jgi:hypothetical protein
MADDLVDQVIGYPVFLALVLHDGILITHLDDGALDNISTVRDTYNVVVVKANGHIKILVWNCVMIEQPVGR